MSEYFRNALRLGSHLAKETPANAYGLPDFDDDEVEYLRQKLTGDGMPKEEESIYWGKWKYRVSLLFFSRLIMLFQNPDKDSVPSAWEAGARLRVACFFIGLFNTMVDYMNRDIGARIEYWRENFLHSGDSSMEENRRQFWYSVTTAALHELRSNSENRKLMESWLYQNPEPTISNEKINRHLMRILKKPIKQFFNHPVITECLRRSLKLFRGPWERSSSSEQPVPFLFIIDEAAHLFQSNYMHSFMWVLDQPIMKILSKLQIGDLDISNDDLDISNNDLDIPNDNASNFFILMLGTHSQISHFAPDYTYPSARYFSEKQYIPSVFLSLDWDTGLCPSNGKSEFRASAHIKNLVQWGRPLWNAVYDGHRPSKVNRLIIDKKDKSDLRRCVLFAERKLLPSKKEASDEKQLDLSAFAILAIRLHLDLDFAYPSRASQLVSSKMRWLVDMDPRRKHIVTTYGSEPLLVEAAALAMNSYDLLTNPIIGLLNRLRDQLNHGFVNRGQNGELTARLLRKSRLSRLY